MPLADAPARLDPAATSPTAGLTRRLVDGDEAAWRDFHAAYAPRLRRYLFVVCRGQEDTAAEALQQTFLRAVKHLRVCTSEPELWGWLTRLARSAAADAARRERRYLGFLDRWFRHQSEPPAEPPGTAATLESLLAEELAGLPDDERALVEQKYFGGESVRNIAAGLGTTEKAVESRLTRARQKLKAGVLARLQHDDLP